jgi:hypothetical protein
VRVRRSAGRFLGSRRVFLNVSLSQQRENGAAFRQIHTLTRECDELSVFISEAVGRFEANRTPGLCCPPGRPGSGSLPQATRKTSYPENLNQFPLPHPWEKDQRGEGQGSGVRDQLAGVSAFLESKRRLKGGSPNGRALPSPGGTVCGRERGRAWSPGRRRARFATVKLARDISAFLVRARHDPGFRFRMA